MTAEPVVIDAVLKDRGFIWEHTGGGCTAYLKFDGSFSTYITKHDDASAPQTLSDAVDIGVYREDTGDLVEWIARNVPLVDALRHLTPVAK